MTTGTPRFFGISSSEIIPQSAFNATGNEEGRISATHEFKCKRDYFESFIGQQLFREGTRATTLDPDLSQFWSFLKLTHTDSRYDDGGWMTITAHFTGFWSATYDGDTSADRPATYSLNGTLEEVNILEHPKVVALTGTLERDALKWILDGTAEWNTDTQKIGTRSPDDGSFNQWGAGQQFIVSANALVFADLIASGVTTYKRPSFTWTKNEETDTALAAADLNNLGKIDTPDGSPPTPSGSRDWMLISADSTQHGTADPTYTNTLTWLLSDREGWDSDLYS